MNSGSSFLRTTLSHRPRLPAVAVALVAAIELGAQASTNNFVVPTFRGSANSEVGYWENFSVAYGAPGNAATMAGSTTGANLTQTLSASAFVTGSGNLYDPAAATAFTLADSVPYTLGTVVLQVRTLGAELKYDAIRLNYVEDGVPRTVDPLPRVELDRGTILGASVSSLWQWDLQGLGVMDYDITFESDGSSLSLDSVTIDTWNQFQVVPEPSGKLLLAVGVLLLGGFLRRVRP